jgi:hypothetical protein
MSASAAASPTSAGGGATTGSAPGPTGLAQPLLRAESSDNSVGSDGHAPPATHPHGPQQVGNLLSELIEWGAERVEQPDLSEWIEWGAERVEQPDVSEFIEWGAERTVQAEGVLDSAWYARPLPHPMPECADPKQEPESVSVHEHEVSQQP